jgi:hypothetical protein
MSLLISRTTAYYSILQPINAAKILSIVFKSFVSGYEVAL